MRQSRLQPTIISIPLAQFPNTNRIPISKDMPVNSMGNIKSASEVNIICMVQMSLSTFGLMAVWFLFIRITSSAGLTAIANRRKCAQILHNKRRITSANAIKSNSCLSAAFQLSSQQSQCFRNTERKKSVAFRERF